MMKLAAHALVALSLLCLVQGWASTAAPRRQAGAPAPAAAGAQSKQQPKDQPKPQPDYVEVQGTGHYKAHVEKATWREAQAACEAEGAHLLVLNSKKEAAAVADLIARQPPALSNELHAGFFRPDYFVTVFGVPLSSVGYQKWAPDQQHIQICGSVNRDVLLYDAKCTDKRSFICEFKKDSAAFKLTDPPIIVHDPPTQQPYTPTQVVNKGEYKGLVQQGRLHYYRVSKTKMRWAQANLVCKEEEAHLLVLNHQFEADTLKEHLKQFSGLSDALYVGLRNGNNKFVTLFGKSPLGAGYNNWESEQPEDETCLAVDHNMLLKKIPCWEEREFICEKTLV